MEKTEQNELYAALVKAQAEFPVVGKMRTANAGKFSYDYADLADVLKSIVPILTKHELAVIQKPSMTDDGFGLQTLIIHATGQSIDGFYPLPNPTTTKSQDMGSAITYARRYSLTAMCGVVLDDDDDGKKAQEAGVTADKTPVEKAQDWMKAFEIELKLTSAVNDVNALVGREQAALKRLSENHKELWETLNLKIENQRAVHMNKPLD